MRIKSFIRLLINNIANIIGAENALKIEAKIRFHKDINLECPKTLSDKICWLEFKTDNSLVVQCSDKYEVRQFVKEKGLEDILVPLVGDVYDDAQKIDFDILPNAFVLKATYGCQMNLICPDKTKLDITKARTIVSRWLKKGFNRNALEPHYGKIKKQVICEEFLEGAESIIDYKIHCLNGNPRFVLVCSERNCGLKLNLYDLDWNRIEAIRGKHYNDAEIERPSRLNDMIEISRKLAEDFDFVRVDLYQIGEKIYFGELTFTPDGGMLSYYTEEFDYKMGQELQLTKRREK